MSDMKCPFCQQELYSASINGEWLECWNCSYNEPSGHKLPQAMFMGTKELWQALIDTKNQLIVEHTTHDILQEELKKLQTELERTRKVLDKAKWWLNEIVESHRCTPISTAEMALKEITALEQKD